MSNINLKFLFIALFSTLFTSCNNNFLTDNTNVFTPVTKKEYSLHWLSQWYGEGKKEDLVREIVRDFSFQNQDIEIDLEFPHQMLSIDANKPSFFGTRDSILQMIKLNKWPYDFMLCDSYLYDHVARQIQDKEWGKKYLEDFCKEQWFIDAHKEDVFLNKIHIDKFGGIAPGAFIEAIWNLLYVSSTVEDKLGIKVKQFDMTIDDFIEYAKVVYQYNETHDDKITFFSLQWDGGINNLFNQLVMSEVASTSNPNSLEIFQRVYEKFETLSQYSPLNQYTKFSDENERELQHEKVLFNYSYSWIMMFWQSNNPEGAKKMKACLLPSMPGKKSNSIPGKYNPVFVVPKFAKNKDAAIKLMKFITSEEIANKWEEYTKCPTGLKSKIALNELGTDAFNVISKTIKENYNNKLEDANLSKLIFNSNLPLKFQTMQVLMGEVNANSAVEDLKEQIKQ